MRDFRQVMAIQGRCKNEWLKVEPELKDVCGIYILTRNDENGFRYAYVGQAKHILTRLSQHLIGYQYIDLSLKKHGLFDKEKNPYGWGVKQIFCDSSELDEKERYYISEYATNGFQMRNNTIGGQGKGKSDLGEHKCPKNYHEGLANGYLKARREISKLFEKNLDVIIQGNDGVNKQKALAKFKEFINVEK